MSRRACPARCSLSHALADLPFHLADFYFERKPEKSEHPVVCACEPPSDPNLLGCREDCMNR